MTLEELKALLEAGLIDVKEFQKKQAEHYKKLDSNLEKLSKEKKLSDTELSDLKNTHLEQTEKVAKLDEIIQSIVEKMSDYKEQGATMVKTLGELAAQGIIDKEIDCDTVQLATLCKANMSLFSKSITTGVGSAGALTESDRVGIVTAPEMPLTIRDLLTTVSTSLGSIEWLQELLFTNSAAPQAGEGTAKAQSDITYQKQNTPVQTLAHWFGVSRQALADVSGLRSMIDKKGIYGLKLKEDAQLLLGDGTGNNLSGLQTNATAYDVAGLAISGDTKVDQIRRAIYQSGLSFMPVTGIVLHPKDWMDLELQKDANDAYLFANPFNQTETRLWGRPVVPSYQETVGEFLLGAFSTAATLYDRESVSVRVSEHHANFFIENMVAILIEERLALTVERPDSFITGTLAVTP